MAVPLGDPSLFHDVEQGTDEWKRLRLGKITGSAMKNVIAWKFPKPTKTDPNPAPQEGADRIKYRKRLVTERLEGELGEDKIFVTDAMKWGSLNEDTARQQYQLAFRRRVRQVGIIDHPELAIAYSPDGLVDDDGMIEIKCLEPWNHLYEIVAINGVPEVFIPQIQMGLWITDREWCDFIGYDSRAPKGLDLFSVRVERDQDYINYLEDQAKQMLAEVERDVSMFLRYMPVVEFACQICGVVATSKITICRDCGANAPKVIKTVQDPDIKLLNIFEKA